VARDLGHPPWWCSSEGGPIASKARTRAECFNEGGLIPRRFAGFKLDAAGDGGHDPTWPLTEPLICGRPMGRQSPMRRIVL